MGWYAFLQTLTTNAILGPLTASVSNKYQLKITPKSETFAIWSVIYYGLALFLLQNKMDDETSSLFERSMELNRDWLSAFVVDDTLRSLEIITELRKVNDALAVKVDDHYVWIYATWVRVATVLNESIVEVYGGSNQKDVISMERLSTFVRTITKFNLNRAQQMTLQWAVQGIPTKFLTVEEFAELKSIQRSIGGGYVTMQQLFLSGQICGKKCECIL